MYPQSTKELVKTVLPDFFLTPKTISNIQHLPSFLSTLHHFERLAELPFEVTSTEIQEKLILRRLTQLIEICRVNPIWKERINLSIGKDQVRNFEHFMGIPLTDKETYTDLFSGQRKGMVVPLKLGGFQIANSGGTASGRASEIVFSKKELRNTYQWAGGFMGRHIISRFLDQDQACWVGTTLADSQLWSSGTMVGGVLQEIPDINYLAIGDMSPQIYQRIMQNDGQKALMGIVRDISMLVQYGETLNDKEKQSLHIALYGSGILPEKVKKNLVKTYPNLNILSFFAATQAETIGLQLNPQNRILTAVPGLHLIEIIDENGRWVKENEEGELVVTRLFANEAPVLRYKLGDRVIRRPDLKTQALHAMQFEYVGRSDDFVILNDHRFYIPHVLPLFIQELNDNHLFDFNDVAEEYQFQVHDRETMLRLLIVTPNHASYNRLYEQNKKKINAIFIDALIKSLNKPDSSEILAQSCLIKLQFIHHDHPSIYRTDVGKTPLIARNRS